VAHSGQSRLIGPSIWRSSPRLVEQPPLRRRPARRPHQNFGPWRSRIQDGGTPPPTLASLPAGEGNMIASLRRRPAAQVIGLRAILIDTSCRYFVNVLAVTATLSANSVANGSTTKVGCRLNGSAREITHVRTSSGSAERLTLLVDEGTLASPASSSKISLPRGNHDWAPESPE